MAIILVDNGSKYTKALQKLLTGHNYRTIYYKELDYKKLSKQDVVILSGGHAEPILWHKKQYYQETALVKKHKGPIIGICLGFEIIAHVYGSHLHLYNERRKGEVELYPTGIGDITIPATVNVYENHNWSVIKLRRPLRPLAYSKDGVEIFKHSRKPIYGLQFHPEESSIDAMILFSQIFDKLVDSSD